jgi:hypothetical protein
MFLRQQENTAIIEAVFSTRSMPKCYQQGQLAVAVSELENCCGSVIANCCCEKLVAETRGQFRNPEEGKHPPLEVAAKQQQ